MMDTSSFFWLGLVVALFLGLFLTVFRVRNARRAATSAQPQFQVPLVRPELWEVNVAPQAFRSGADNVVRRWEELLPMAARITMREEPPSTLQKSRRVSRWRKWRMRHRARSTDPSLPNVDNESRIQEAQIAMVILLPSPQAKPRYSVSSSDSVDPHYIPEYALGTIGYRMDYV